MRSLNIFKTVTCCLVACGMILMASSQAKADTVYTITGFANNLGSSDPNSPVGIGEAYTATFQIDGATADSNPLPGDGLFLGAITSSSIVFAEGYESAVDFAGGSVIVQQDNGGGGIILNDTLGLGALVLFSPTPLDSDALLTEPQEISGLPGSLWSLTEPTGVIVSGSIPLAPLSSKSAISTAELGTGPIVLTVSAAAVPEPTAAGLLGLGLVIVSVRRRRK